MDDRHIRMDKDDVYSGTVRTVVLPGIWNLSTKKVERRSVVICQ